MLVFGFMIFIHELGHFTCARIFGVTVKEFSIGMGPKIFKRVSKKSGTSYALGIFPIGGYVSMVGEDEDSDDENAFFRKPVWQRLIITVAGAFMNILTGIIVMFLIVFITKSLASTTIYDFGEGAVSSHTGLMAGDRIVEVGGYPVHTGNELVYEIMHAESEAVEIEVNGETVSVVNVDLAVVRDGKKIELENVSFKAAVEQGVTFGNYDFIVYGERVTFANLLKHAFFRSISTVKMIWDSIIDLVSGRFGIEAVSGPVGVTGAIGQAASAGALNFFNIFVIISMNLGVVNLLPLPALDGGRIVFLLIEAIRRKPLKPEVENIIHGAGLLLLFGFMIFISIKDVIGLF